LAVFLQLFVLLLLTRAFGEAAERFGQPASVGEILAGVALAAVAVQFGDAIPLMAALTENRVLEAVANVAIFFLVLLAGIEMQPGELAEASRHSLLVALGGVVVPFAGGFALAWAFLPETDHKQAQAVMVAVALSISAIPATIKVFSDSGLLHTRLGETVVSAAVFDDIIGLFLLAVLVSLIETGNVPDLTTFSILLVKVVAFFAVTIALGAHVYPRVSRGAKALQAASMELSALAAVALGYGLLAEALGMHWILGAFVAGLFFEPSRVGSKAYNEIKLIFGAVTRGFLGPLFFASIGVRVDLTAVTGVPVFLVLLVLVAFFGKLLGAGLPALWAGFDRRESLAVGVGMSARGAIELVVLSIASEAGLFAQGDQGHPVVAHLFSALILMAVATTLLTPLLLRLILKRGSPPR
jgi:Kef-type K+ transport system membrane component KefB